MNDISSNHWIEKSKALIYAEWSKFDVYELQIFETYLSRINPRDPESSCVRFTRNEYAKMMGYADGRNLKAKTLNKWVRNFIQKQISIAYEGGTKHFNLFSDADVHLDQETGEVVIDLDCNMKLKPVFFNIAEAGYISYKRLNTINLKSEYSIKLYCILKDHSWKKKKWDVDLHELKNMLGATEPLYSKFAEFNRRILKKSVDEINEKTDISVSYEKKTRGRLIIGLIFNITNRNISRTNANQLSLDDMEITGDPPAADDDGRDLWRDALRPYEFSPAQIDEIQMYARKNVLSDSDNMFLGADLDLKIYEYLEDMVRYVRVRESQTPIKNLYRYFLKCIREDAINQ